MTFVDAIRESEIRKLFLFWCACRQRDCVPERSAIDPARIPHRLLPHMFIFARDKNERYYLQLVGTALTRIYGRDDTGRGLDEILPPKAALQRRHLYDRILESGLPAYVRGLAIVKTGEQRMCSRILLPLVSRKGEADQILGLMRFSHGERPLPEQMALRAISTPREILFATDEDLDPQSGPASEEIRAATD